MASSLLRVAIHFARGSAQLIESIQFICRVFAAPSDKLQSYRRDRPETRKTTSGIRFNSGTEACRLKNHFCRNHLTQLTIVDN
jgi:hypothetical protein